MLGNLPFSFGSGGPGAPGIGAPTVTNNVNAALSPMAAYGGMNIGTQPGTGVDIGALGRSGLLGATMMGGPLGMLASLGNLGLHANNLGTTNGNLQSLGLAPLGFGQTLGAMLGMNGYANGSPMGLASAIGAQMPGAISNAMAGRSNAMAFGANPGGGFVGPGNSPAAPGVSASEAANNGMAAGPV